MGRDGSEQCDHIGVAGAEARAGLKDHSPTGHDRLGSGDDGAGPGSGTGLSQTQRHGVELSSDVATRFVHGTGAGKPMEVHQRMGSLVDDHCLVADSSRTRCVQVQIGGHTESIAMRRVDGRYLRSCRTSDGSHCDSALPDLVPDLPVAFGVERGRPRRRS